MKTILIIFGFLILSFLVSFGVGTFCHNVGEMDSSEEDIL